MEPHRRGPRTMMLRARGAKTSQTPTTSSSSPSPSSLDIEQIHYNERPTQTFYAKSSSSSSYTSRMRTITRIIIIGGCLGLVLLCYFAFFTSLRHQSDIDHERTGGVKNYATGRTGGVGGVLKNTKVVESPVTPVDIGGAAQVGEFDYGDLSEGLVLKGNIDWETVVKHMHYIKKEFYTRYAGVKVSRELYEKGIIPLNEGSAHLGKKHIADLIISRIKSDDVEPVHLSFGGYSVTVGRGNYFHQSYPFVMHKILEPLFESLSIPLKVHNGAIGGIPSFPYGWCLKNFLGAEASVINWDYAMNEQNSVQGLESYIRNAVATMKEKPILIVLDTDKKNKKDLLSRYVETGILKDAIFLRSDDYVPEGYFHRIHDNLPEGLENWDRWGAPPGAPGQSPWHPKYKRHELMGWVLAMHFLEGVEHAVKILSGKIMPSHDTISSENTKTLIAPISGKLNDESLRSLFMGADVGDGTWKMNAISCRTSFQPTLSGHLKEIVKSGMVQPKEDILQTRSDEYYKQGWTVDVGETERSTKNKVMKYGGLGYIDMKEALYAIPASGVLELLLPYELSTSHFPSPLVEKRASHYFRSLVLCEVSEKRTKQECDMETNLIVTVGGVRAPNTKKIGETGVEYLGKKICLNVEIPNDATVAEETGGEIGLSVSLAVQGSVTRANGACTLSHVVWEHAPLKEGVAR